MTIQSVTNIGLFPISFHFQHRKMSDFLLPYLLIFCIYRFLCHIVLASLGQTKLSKLNGSSWIGSLSFPSDPWPQHQDGVFLPAFCKQPLFRCSLHPLKYQAHHKGKPFFCFLSTRTESSVFSCGLNKTGNSFFLEKNGTEGLEE